MTLSDQITQATAQETILRAREKNPSTDPRIGFEAGESADRLAREIMAMNQQKAGNQGLIEQIQIQINYLEKSPHQSAHRTLALRHLEDAQSRLIRENGI